MAYRQRKRGKDDEWRVTESARRKRKPITLTLAIMTIHHLERMAEKEGVSRSRIIDRLVAEAKG